MARTQTTIPARKAPPPVAAPPAKKKAAKPAVAAPAIASNGKKAPPPASARVAPAAAPQTATNGKAAPARKAPPTGASTAVQQHIPADVLKAMNEATAKIASLEAQLAKANAKSAKGTITAQEAENTENIVSAKDWRRAYAGTEIVVREYREKGESVELLSDRTFAVLCSIPRDADVKGARARSSGYLALWQSVREDGVTYEGPPAYIAESELALIRAE